MSGATTPGGMTAREEFRRGWTLLVACAVGVGCSAIALPFYTIGPLTKPIAADLGWERADIQFAVIFSSGIGALTAPLTGWLIDRFGPRTIALPSLVGVAIGMLVASFATSLTGFWTGYALAAILGAGSNPVLWSRVVAGSFEKARGAALGLALVGTALVALLLPGLVAAIVPEYGWRGALRVIAALPIVIALPIALLWLRPHAITRCGSNEARGETGRTLREALTSRHFWLITGSILFAYLAISGALTNLVPALTDSGISSGEAAAMAGTVGITMIPGRILSGVLMDRFYAPVVAAIMLVFPAIACLILRESTDAPALFAACAMLGLAAGAELDVLAFLTARYFGLVEYARIYAFIYAALATGSATAPTLFARIHDATGSYATSFTLAAGLFVLAALLLLLLGRYPQFSDTRMGEADGVAERR